MRSSTDHLSTTLRATWLAPVGLCVLLAMLSGCMLRNPEVVFDDDIGHFKALAKAVEYADADVVEWDQSIAAGRPTTIEEEPAERVPLYMTPQDAIQVALANSTVLRDLGVLVLQRPDSVQTIHGPALAETDPRYGIEAALSAFDTQFLASYFADNNDYYSNNELLSGGTHQLQQDLNNGRIQLSKRAATGTQFFLRHNIDYEANNIPVPPNTFHSYWTANVETEFRHPLLQGSGVDFNRVAGPYATPGNYNGVVLARINTDISLAEFELGLRDVVSGVEDAYWNLYFAYRKLDAKIASRNAAYTAWQEIKAKGEDRPEEIEARMAYLTAEQEVQDALTGRLGETSPSLVNNPSQGSVPTPLQTVSGLQVLERRLRLLMGMPINDGQIIVPTLDPSPAPVAFEWDEVTSEALARRSELKRQRQQIKRAELQLAASRNFLLPRFDLVGRYRWRGFGHSLLNAERDLPDPIDNAYASMVSGDYQEWRVGGELTFPVGFRQAHSAVRFAQLQVARDKAVLQEQERHVINDLSNAYAELRNVQEVVRRMYNLRVAAHERVAKIEERRQVGGLPGTEGDTPDEDRLRDQLMEARRRAAEADIEYYAALVSYAKSIKGVHFQKGSLLEYNNIFLAEDTWGGKRSTRPPAEMNYQLDPSRRGEVLDPNKGEFELPAELEPRSPSDRAANPDLLEGVAPPAFQDRRGRTSLPPADAYSPPDSYTPSDAYVPSDAPGAGARGGAPRLTPDAPPTADLLEDVSPPQFRSGDRRGAAGFAPVVVAPATPANQDAGSGSVRANSANANGVGPNSVDAIRGGANSGGLNGIVTAPAERRPADVATPEGTSTPKDADSPAATLANRARRMSTTTISRDGSTVRAARSATTPSRGGGIENTESNMGESADSKVEPNSSSPSTPPIGIEKPAADLLDGVSPPTFQTPARRTNGRTSSVAPASSRQIAADAGNGDAVVRRASGEAQRGGVAPAAATRNLERLPPADEADESDSAPRFDAVRPAGFNRSR